MENASTIGAPSLASADVVEMRGITKTFGAVTALRDVSISFRPGEVHGLIGENGAGKSTLMNILSGALTPSTGALLIRGEAVHLRHPADAQRRGVAMIHQELNVVPELTVADNIFLGHERCRRGLVRWQQTLREARGLLASIGCDLDPARKVGALSIAQQQMVEIAKALSHNASVLVMDEPTAVLTQREVTLLMRLIGELRSRGVAVIYISHILSEILRLCDRVTVLRDGQVVHRYAGLAGVTERDLANQMVGRELSDQFPERGTPGANVVLRVQDMRVPGHVHGAGFEVRQGEIFGFAGLVGSGRTELNEAVAGLRPRAKGSVTVNDRPLPRRNPRAAVAAGIAYVSEDRRGAGLLMGMDIVQNTTIVSLPRYCHPFIDRAAETAATAAHVRDLSIKVGRLRDLINTLSGGNQQKVALAKWLETQPRVLILDEPTRGIDVGAKAEIYRLIKGLAERGLACVLISSELNELLGLCHRIAVMRSGTIRAVLDGPSATEQSIMQVAAGVTD